MRIIGFAFFFFYTSFFIYASETELSLSKEIYQSKEMGFLSHGNYLTMSIHFRPVKALHQSLQEREGVKLRSRGEAHITVITPIEFSQVLKEKISIRELEKMAKEAKIQETPFEVICLGQGKKVIKKKEESTFFIVVTSEQLLHFRQQVEKLFRERGGRKEAFQADHFYPHITVGFTKRDLHEQDGVIKGINSCYAGLSMIL